MASSRDQERSTPEWADTDTDMTEDTDDVEFEVRWSPTDVGAQHAYGTVKLIILWYSSPIPKASTPNCPPTKMKMKTRMRKEPRCTLMPRRAGYRWRMAPCWRSLMTMRWKRRTPYKRTGEKAVARHSLQHQPVRPAHSVTRTPSPVRLYQAPQLQCRRGGLDVSVGRAPQRSAG